MIPLTQIIKLTVIRAMCGKTALGNQRIEIHRQEAAGSAWLTRQGWKTGPLMVLHPTILPML